MIAKHGESHSNNEARINDKVRGSTSIPPPYSSDLPRKGSGRGPAVEGVPWRGDWGSLGFRVQGSSTPFISLIECFEAATWRGDWGSRLDFRAKIRDDGLKRRIRKGGTVVAYMEVDFLEGCRSQAVPAERQGKSSRKINP